MMDMLWGAFFVALVGSHHGYGLPIGSTPETYPYDGSRAAVDTWSSQGGLYALVLALALLITAIGLLLGCTWCYRHKDCKPNRGADNQLFAASATHLHDVRRPNPPDSGFSEPVNNNISEDNNNGPISLREMQNIANNNAAAYIVSENEERNRVSRESVVEFEPLPADIRVADPLEPHADWFDGEDFPRNRLQYLREIGRGWFGRVVEGEIEDEGSTSTVAVKILNQNASLEDKARFLQEARMYRDVRHENILGFISKCLTEDPWIMIYELCPMDLQQYLIANRQKMTALSEGGVPLRLMCDVTAALAHLHSRGLLYGNVWTGAVLVRGASENPRAVLGSYASAEPNFDIAAPETRRNPSLHMASSEVFSLGALVWQVWSWGRVPSSAPAPPPDLLCPYRAHLYQVMQLCWNPDPESRPTSAQVHALLDHLYTTHTRASDSSRDDGYGSSDFEERWQRLKPNSIPVKDEHVAIVHAPSTSMASHFTGSEEFDNPPTIQDSLSVDMDTAVSRSSSIMSDKDPLSVQIKSESLTNLHGSLEDVRNIYLTHNEMAVLECHQGNIALEDCRDTDQDHDRSDSSMDPWLKEIIAGSQDDVSYYKDVSDVIKNLDNILNSEKTSSSESSHQASPSRDNLSLDCKKDYPMQSNMVKSPGINNFQNILESGIEPASPTNETCVEDEVDRETIGTLSHSFERHSDTLSQQTLENLTPETPIKDLDIASNITPDGKHIVEEVIENESSRIIEIGKISPLPQETELPKENKVVSNNSQIPMLKELCVASTSSISETKHKITNATQDCLRSCDSNLADERTDDKQIETKSIDDVVRSNNLLEAVTTDQNKESENQEAEIEKSKDVLPDTVELESKVQQDISSVTLSCENATDLKEDFEHTQQDVIDTSNNVMKSETIISNEIKNTLQEPLKHSETEIAKQAICSRMTEAIDHFEPEAPESVQKPNNSEQAVPISPLEVNVFINVDTESIANSQSSPEIVQKMGTETITEIESKVQNDVTGNDDVTFGSEYDAITAEKSSDSTVYMDLINVASSEIVKDSSLDENVKETIKSCLDSTNTESVCTLVKNESTIYMDLPSMIKETDEFLHYERVVSSSNIKFKDLCSSTPLGSDKSNDETLETSMKNNETVLLSETKVPDYGPGVAVTKLEQRYVPDNLSPFDSPTKSHHTDTYDENSSVVLGPFENYTLELFKGAKSGEIVDLPREELLAFSSNFSDINLETPSPLRDGRFLHEVPDIIPDDVQFDDIETISEIKVEQYEPQSESISNDTDCQSETEKRVSPLTPPNSPGTFLVSTAAQPSYIVDIDLDPVPGPSHLELDPTPAMTKEVDLNQIELQITTKLAMAENENNLNIEYSGDGMPDESNLLLDMESEESILAGNGSTLPRKVEIDEECVQALRNELELKLPLAQVANIEPASTAEWGGSLPPPPELVVNYPGALSPIPEETKQQLCAVENDLPWSISSESYPEPCGSSQADTVPPTCDSPHDRTYTLRPDLTNEDTMSADSLNASPHKKPAIDTTIDDKTYTKHDDEKESNCERISQVSPFILSPTTDNSDFVDNGTGVSTLSKTTVPTDAKSSKPSETQCLSKASSIDSWCSNDTLYNVEENFDDLAMDPDVPLDFEKDEHSESSHTLTHNDEDKELSHCSTYIVHDSKSEACETFSPDSITANDNNTYTKAKTEVTGATPSIITKSDVDSTKNTQTKDLAYGTLMSGLPSYSNCTTEVASGFEDPWKMQQPEMVRRSPMGDNIDVTPPKIAEEKDSINESPQILTQPCINKMDSVDISCLHDNLAENHVKSDDSNQIVEVEVVDSPNSQYKNMAPSVTSTPLVEAVPEYNSDEAIPMELPDTNDITPDFITNKLPNFQTFLQSAEVRPQDLSSSNEGANSQNTEILLEGDSKTLSRNSNHDTLANDRTPNYSDFESSAMYKPQDVHSTDRSSQSMDSGMNSEEFKNFENSVRNRPQDLSSVIDASSLLLNSERKFSELATIDSTDLEQTSQSGTRLNNNEPMQSLDVSPPNDTNLIESQYVDKPRTPSNFFIQSDVEDETEQPHSIIITENDVLIKESPNRTYDSHTGAQILNHTYDSHATQSLKRDNIESPDANSSHVKVNGIRETDDTINFENISPKIEAIEEEPSKRKEEKASDNQEGLVQAAHATEHTSNNGDDTSAKDTEEIKCNGSSEKYATVQFINETFEELTESNVDDGESKDLPNDISETSQQKSEDKSEFKSSTSKEVHEVSNEKVLNELAMETQTNGVHDSEDEKLTSVTENFLQNEKMFCQLDAYLPLLSDIRFTGPASEIMSTSFTQDSPTEPTSPEREQDGKPDVAADILKEWDSDSDSNSTNSSSGEFIWKQRGNGTEPSADNGGGEQASSGSGDSGSGSEGDEVEFVPSSWDCRAAPAKSSLRSLEQATPDNKKRVVFKRQKYHCVYEYPREACDVDARSPAAYMPDLSTYTDWDPTSSEEAELGYGQLFGSPNPLDMYPLRSGITFDYDDDFFISSSARPFESLGIMSTTSQFFPGMHVKGSLLERELSDDVTEDFPPPPSPLPTATLIQTRTPSLDFTTPDSGVEDITPGSTSADDEYKAKKIPEDISQCWRPVDSGSSSESVSPSSPGGEALGGLRHTRDKLKLDLPPSPHIPSPRHNRVFNFVLDKPKRHRIADEKVVESGTTPLVMTDETPVVTSALPLQKECEDLPLPEPTFSTFGKGAQKLEPEQKIILTDDVEHEQAEVKAESPKANDPVKGEGTVLDSGDEDSGIESSSKATLERNKTPNVS
ncbi:hypothetical protein evm_007292 [Chilo suppressalis]|nr:hypothetical protein evm_007292 [Chilo suppressalis]